MSLLDGFLNKALEKHEDAVLTAVQKMLDRQEGRADPDDIEVLAKDYFDLIKAVRPGSRPRQVELDADDPDLVIVDGAAYDFSDVPHDDLTNTGRRMEIEALLTDQISVDELQVRLSEKIQKEW